MQTTTFRGYPLQDTDKMFNNWRQPKHWVLEEPPTTKTFRWRDTREANIPNGIYTLEMPYIFYAIGNIKGEEGDKDYSVLNGIFCSPVSLFESRRVTALPFPHVRQSGTVCNFRGTITNDHKNILDIIQEFWTAGCQYYLLDYQAPEVGLAHYPKPVQRIDTWEKLTREEVLALDWPRNIRI